MITTQILRGVMNNKNDIQKALQWLLQKNICPKIYLNKYIKSKKTQDVTPD
jgi:hypothetical protein